MGLTMIIPEWFLVVLAIFFTANIFFEWRKGNFAKKTLKLEKEKLNHEKEINQYAKVLANAKRVADTPKHSRR